MFSKQPISVYSKLSSVFQNGTRTLTTLKVWCPVVLSRSFLKLKHGMLLFAIGALFFSNLQASEVNELPAAKADMVKDPELYIDQVLDEMLGEDPSVISLDKELGLNKAAETSQHTFSSTIGAGVENNILEQQSPLLNSRKGYYYLDYLYFNGGESEDNVFLLVYFENTTYPDIDVAGDVQSLVISFATETWLGKAFMFAAALDYAALVDLDSGNAEENRVVDTIRSDDYAVEVSWQYEIANNYYTLLGLNWEHSFSEELIDRYYQTGASAGLKRQYGEDSELLLSLAYNHSIYPEDEVTDVDGSFYKGETLENEFGTIVLANDHYWMGEPGINLNSSIAYKVHQDNGPGYDLYDEYSIGESLRITMTRWTFIESLDLTYTQYKKRTLETKSGNTEKLYNFEIEFSLAMERSIGDQLSVKAEVEAFKTESNDKDKEYEGSSFLLSSSWIF